MNLWVRLIGGLHDGEVQKVDEDQRELVMRKKLPAPAARIHSLAPTTTEAATTCYTWRKVATRDGDVIFYALGSFSDLDALQHALGP